MSSAHRSPTDAHLQTRALRPSDRPWIDTLVSEHLGSSRIVSRGVLHDAQTLPGLIAELDGVPVGLLLYRIHAGQCEVVVLIAARRREGVGRRLLEAVRPIAMSAGSRRLWLITTNANRAALAFYRAVGWREVAVHRGAMREARRLKPEIPLSDTEGTPIDDEIEHEHPLVDASERPLDCVAFMLVRDGAVLVERRTLTKTLAPGALAIPGGHVEPGESLEDALARELREEVGVSARDTRYVCTLFHRAEELRKLHYFAVERWDGAITAGEAEALRWLRFDEMHLLDFDVDRTAIEEYVRAKA